MPSLCDLMGNLSLGDGDIATKKPDPLSHITQEQFNDGRDRRFGTTNPERIDIPF